MGHRARARASFCRRALDRGLCDGALAMARGERLRLVEPQRLREETRQQPVGRCIREHLPLVRHARVDLHGSTRVAAARAAAQEGIDRARVRQHGARTAPDHRVKRRARPAHVTRERICLEQRREHHHIWGEARGLDALQLRPCTRAVAGVHVCVQQRRARAQRVGQPPLRELRVRRRGRLEPLRGGVFGDASDDLFARCACLLRRGGRRGIRRGVLAAPALHHRRGRLRPQSAAPVVHGRSPASTAGGGGNSG
mmetsp:Transcript_9341/g.38291  ORF Transcript_9341/g.38291 Transcript_9341/m.38291 type:complete len:254 (-) Transcript_9341:32-793(-)